MNNIDKLIREKAHSEKSVLPKDFDSSIDEILENLGERHLAIRKSKARYIIAAALIAVISLTAVYAKDIPLVNSIIDFFKGDSNQHYSSDAGVYEKYSASVGKTITDNGVSITIDNIACDDNFLVLFYTVQGDGEKVSKGEGGVNIVNNLIGDIKINGKPKNISNNDEFDNAYVTDNGMVKGMIRTDISGDSLTDDLKVDFIVSTALRKSGQWDFKLDVSKKSVSKDSRIYNVNKALSIKYPDGKEHNINIDKVSFTPFGNQIILSEKFNTKVLKYDKEGQAPLSLFALFDDKGNQLDVIRGQIISGMYGARNSFEFLNGSKDIKSLTLVPIYTFADNEPKEINSEPIITIDKFPLELKMSSKGSVVIDKIVYGENDTKIYYKNKGTVLYRPSITLLDNGGRNMLENVPILFQNNVVDRDSGLYVNILPKLDGNKVSKLQYVTDEKFELLYDYKISIPLK